MDDGFQFARKLVLGGGFLAHEAEGAFELIAAACAVGGLVAAATLKVVESLQAEDLAEHFLALGGGLVGELVGATLNEEGAVDEGVVVHADDAVYLELGLTDAVAGYGMKAGGAFQLKLEVAAAGATKAADDAVVGVGGLELQNRRACWNVRGARRSLWLLPRALPQRAQVMASRRADLPWPFPPQRQATRMPVRSRVGTSSR